MAQSSSQRYVQEGSLSGANKRGRQVSSTPRWASSLVHIDDTRGLYCTVLGIHDETEYLPSRATLHVQTL
jgi:hypothetical protein